MLSVSTVPYFVNKALENARLRRLEELERENARLRMAVAKYGEHRAGCQFETDACTCGYDKTMRGDL